MCKGLRRSLSLLSGGSRFGAVVTKVVEAEEKGRKNVDSGLAGSEELEHMSCRCEAQEVGVGGVSRISKRGETGAIAVAEKWYKGRLGGRAVGI